MTRCPHGEFIPEHPFESGLHPDAAWPQCPCCKHLVPRTGCMKCDPEGTQRRRLEVEASLYDQLRIPASEGYFHHKEAARVAPKRRWGRRKPSTDD